MDRPLAERLALALAIIEHRATLQQRLIADLLDLSRIKAGSFELRLASVSLGRVVDAALATLATKAMALAPARRSPCRCRWPTGR